MTLTTGSLFAGYGGLDMAVNAYFGSRTAWFVENHPAPSRILAHHWPDVPNHGDITTIDWSQVEPVDILCAGFPCFTADVPVLTSRGFVPIQDVKVDDLVLTHRNRWRKVTATMNRQANEVVEFAPGMFATPEHRFYTRQPGRRWDNDARSYRRTLGDTEWTDAQNLAGQFVARPINIPSPTNEIRKPITPPGMTWWQVGRWLADGWTSGPEKRVVCVAVGGAKVGDLNRLPGWKVAEQRTVHRAYICNKATADWLTAEFGSGAYGKTVPAWALWMPIADRRELLDGYWSGDAYLQGASIRSTSVSPTLMVGIRALAESCGYSTSLSYTRTPDTTVIEGRTVNQRNWWRLDARVDYGRYTERDGVFTWSKVRKLGKTITDPTTVYDLTVDEDHSFTAAGIVVHNCQDVSAAGRRAGLMHGTRTGLFHNTIEAIDALRPRWVVLENVTGLLSADGEPWTPELVQLHDEAYDSRSTKILNLIERTGGYALGRKWNAAEIAGMVRQHKRALARFSASRRRLVQRAIGTVVGELAAIGYDTQWQVVSAADVGACHRRERVFIVATPADAVRIQPERRRGLGVVGCAPREDQGAEEERQRDGHATRGGGAEAVATTGPARLHDAVEILKAGKSDEYYSLLPTPRATDGTKGGPNQRGSSGDLMLPSAVQLLGTPRVTTNGMNPSGAANDRSRLEDQVGQLLPTPNASDGSGGGQHPDKREGHSRQLIDYALTVRTGWGDYEAAIRRAEVACGRPAPSPTEPNRNGNPRLSSRFAEWMMMLPEGHVTGIGLSRNEELKALGNGVVVQQAYAALCQLVPISQAVA